MMHATFDADYTVTLLRAAGGDFGRLRAAVDHIRKRRLAITIKPEQVREALNEMDAKPAKKGADVLLTD